MYYIYHQIGVKIGCTDTLLRRINNQKIQVWELLETHEDIYIASERELALQKQYGYQVDRVPYFKLVENFHTREGCSKGGKIVGAMLKFPEVCHIAGGKVASSIKRTCSHCGKEYKLPSFFNHVKKCVFTCFSSNS